MKKLLTSLAGILLALSLFSCGNNIDSSVWLTNFDDAKKAAQAEDKKIFLFFSGDDFDDFSADLKARIFNTEEFIQKYTEKYVLVNLDFSNSRYDKAEEQENIHRDMKVTSIYDVQAMPTFRILSKEGFFITNLAFDKSADLATAKITFDEAEEEIAAFDELLEKTRTGSDEDRLKAIDELYDKTKTSITMPLAELNKLYISLDKENKSGQLPKHLISLAYSKAEDYILNDEPKKAAEEFAKLAKNKLLSNSDRQMSFYTAGYLLVQNGQKDLELVKSYLQKAIDVDPESEESKQIKMELDYVQSMIDGSEEKSSEILDAPGTAPASESASNASQNKAGEEANPAENNSLNQ